MEFKHFPKKQGLYDPANEHDSCGVGFVCNIDGSKSNAIVKKALEALSRMEHRGAVGSDPLTGDGAGVLMQMPHKFFSRIVKQDLAVELPDYGFYGTGLVFLPQNEEERNKCISVFEEKVAEFNLELIGWRDVPVDNAHIGVTARKTEPVIKQILIKRTEGFASQIDFERKLYVVRKATEHAVRALKLVEGTFFYPVSLSSRVFNYKGLLMTEQVPKYFTDLQNDDIESAVALVHSRFATNTFPTWDLAQPFRMVAQNGEINTLRGNVNSLRAKEGKLQSECFSIEDIKAITPVTRVGLSDTATFDNVFELLTLSGRSLAHSVLMMMPSAWENNTSMDSAQKEFYKFHASFMEPWDGPANMAFTDGETIGAVLDRNGLRPARYVVTNDGMVIMASELGVLTIDSANIKSSGRIEPGKIFVVDTKAQKILTDTEVKSELAAKSPYADWNKDGIVDFDTLESKGEIAKIDNVGQLMKAFGYTREDEKIIIGPMADTGKEPVGSMGNDVPHAVLSHKPQMIYTYFKQQFAQVTNPAIDPIREEIVMSNQSFVGKKANILSESADHSKTVLVKRPILTNEDLLKFKNLESKGYKTITLSTLFDASAQENMEKAIDELCNLADKAVADGYTYIILSDRGVDENNAPIPSAIAMGAVHQHLVKLHSRSEVALILETGEPREVHHFAVLFGFGADCINPYLALESVRKLVAEGLVEVDAQKAEYNYIKSVDFGIKKVMSKIGISTLQSYRGSQIFEIFGVHQSVVDRCFTGASSRIGGVKFIDIAWETLAKHKSAFITDDKDPVLATGGQYAWKKDGEKHLWNPDTIFNLQMSTRNEDYAQYKKFAEGINNQDEQPVTLRGTFKFKKCCSKAIDIEEVEPVETIVKRFVTGAMSFGSISRGAHESMAIAMNRLGGQSNTGEGGEEISRFAPMANGDSKRSSIKQVASGRFGVNSNYLTNADEIQIKIAQGAKPGEGGQLPGHKVSVTIANTRFTTPGVTLISPPPHHDIYSIEDLKQLIYDLKNSNPNARISVKLVSNDGIGTVAAGVAKAHADMILISGGDGGTGATPLSSLKHTGVVWELGLSETHQTLILNDLRSRVRLQTDGQMRTGRDVAIAAILGAEEYGFSTAVLIVMGCVMLRHCHLNNCSVGVATQDPTLERKFTGKPEWIVNYMNFVAQELREIMAELGIRKVDDLIGRTDLLEVNKDILPAKAKDLDLSKILYKPEVDSSVGTYCTRKQDHGIDNVLDWKLVAEAKEAIESGKEVEITSKITNIDRTTGGILSNKISEKYGIDGLPNDTIKVKFDGICGQSFGAWLASGVTFELEGIANDYVGKGMSGGKLIIYPDKDTTYLAENNFIIGNTTFYGASRGEAYIRGKAGERFCIRNSGVMAVVEGVGDHGCEYMTGGRVVIIGETGRNFAAGMSGGIAYVLDEDNSFESKCNMEMVEVIPIDEKGLEEVRGLLHDHFEHTNSSKAKYILDNWVSETKKFKKVMPLEYKRILGQQELEAKMGLKNPE